MNMTRSVPEIAAYSRGDLASINCTEPDPYPNWAQHAEAEAHDLRTIKLDGMTIAAMGYVPTSRLEAQAFAVVDRQACKGVGKQVAALIRAQQIQWMEHTGIPQAHASCPANDRAARVFLQVIGYKPAGHTATTANFIMTWSKEHE